MKKKNNRVQNDLLSYIVIFINFKLKIKLKLCIAIQIDEKQNHNMIKYVFVHKY